MNENQYSNNTNQNNKKTKNKILIIGIAISATITLISIIIIIFSLMSNKTQYLFYGEWDCGENIILTIDKSNLNIYKEPDFSIESTYKIILTNVESNVNKYTINASATKRILGGVEYTEPYSTQFEIDMANYDKDSLVMINTSTYSLYMCSRK